MCKLSRFLTTGEVAKKLGMPRWRLAYLIDRGDVGGPAVVVPGRRLFSEQDVDRIRQEVSDRGDDVAKVGRN